jgi:hypothetical protein
VGKRERERKREREEGQGWGRATSFFSSLPLTHKFKKN